MALDSKDALRTNMICTVVLILKFLYATFAQGGERFKLGFAGNQYQESGASCLRCHIVCCMEV